jgi:signal transduction histidine kinase
MRDRVGALGGSMAVISTPGSGTTVRLRIPASQQ